MSFSLGGGCGAGGFRNKPPSHRINTKPIAISEMMSAAPPSTAPQLGPFLALGSAAVVTLTVAIGG